MRLLCDFCQVQGRGQGRDVRVHQGPADADARDLRVAHEEDSGGRAAPGPWNYGWP